MNSELISASAKTSCCESYVVTTRNAAIFEPCDTVVEARYDLAWVVGLGVLLSDSVGCQLEMELPLLLCDPAFIQFP